MNAKLGNFSEISKLLSVKSKMSGDILSLFSNSVLDICFAGCPWRSMMASQLFN